MISVAFYFDKPGLEDLDYSSFLNGNPGMGGSEYEFLLVSQLLARRNTELKVILLSRTVMPSSVKSYYVRDINDACNYCKKNDYDIFIINQGQYDIVSDIDKESLKLVLWAHNDIPEDRMSRINKDDHVKRVIFCGREFLELNYDNLIMRKSTYAYNIFPIQSKKWYIDKIDPNDNHNVVYMGAIVPGKGFDLLAQAWPEVIKKIPNATLYVIGSGRLYDKSAKMGRFGIAEESYENSFMPYLLDKNGKTIHSVHFLGVLGNEKFDILGKCKVGVPNPSGRTETFCLTAIEMQLLGCGLCSIYHPAYLDTILHQEYLYKDTSQLANYIVKRLLSPHDNYDELYDFIVKKFSTEESLQRWENILLHIEDNSIEHYSKNKYHLKPLKSILLQFKLYCTPLADVLPSVEKLFSIKNKIENKIRLY